MTMSPCAAVRLRSVRQRQDVDQVERRQVSRSRRPHYTYSLTNPVARIAGSPVLGAPTCRHPRVDRCQRQLRARLRPEQSRRADLRVGGDICAAVSDQNFGRRCSAAPSIRRCSGAGVCARRLALRCIDSAGGAAGVSAEVGYFRRWLVNFTVTTIAGHRDDFDRFSITAPPIRVCRTAAATCCRSVQRDADPVGQTDSLMTGAGTSASRIGLQRHPDQRHGADAQRADAAGRTQQRQDRDGQL